MELVVIILLTLLMVPLAVLTTGVLRIALGILFLLFFPGYTLMAALFPRKDSVDGIERVALSFGLSIAVVALIGFVLDYTPWGIRLYPIIACVVLSILVTSAVALYRRRRLPEGQRFEPHLHVRLPQWNHQSRLEKALSITLVLSMLGAVGAWGYLVAAPREGERFTEFYVLSSEGTAEGYPQTLVLGQQGEVILAIINQEHQDTSYLVEVVIDGEKIEQIQAIDLAPEQKWEGRVTFVPTKVGKDQKLEFQLYKGEGSEAYRDLSLWLDVEAAK